MRKYLILGLIIGSAIACSKNSVKIHEEYPAEWMYMQRAYPDNIINQKAINDASKIIQSKRQQKSSTIGLWEQRGPLNIGGRVTDLCFSPVNANHIYVGAATGGVFRSYDQGISWQSIFDGWGRPSVGSIAIAPSAPQRIYLGTGEANGSFDSGTFFGDGVYRSDDAGDTWTAAGLPLSNHIGRIIVDPMDPDRVFAAATGLLYGTSPDRGLYRTTNGGLDWEQVLFVSDSTACIDVVMDPTNPDILFAAMWERVRRPWIRDYGGETSGVYRSLDGGDSWQLLGNGLPISTTETGRIGLAISPSDPEIIYASYTTNSITNAFDELYRSQDGGDTWEGVSQGQLQGINSTFGWYFGNLRVNPADPAEVWVLGQSLSRFNVDDQTSEINDDMHVDHHALAYAPTDSDVMIAGNDGGVYISFDQGLSWSHFENLPLTQFYQIEVDQSQPERLYGGAQDNNTLRTLSGDPAGYEAILGGDGFHVNVDPIDNSFVYAEYQWGNLFRSTDGGFNMEWALNGIDDNDRTNWNTPVILSPADPSVLYYGSNRLYKSVNRAVSWSVISPDLTDGLHPSGSLAYGTITAIGSSYDDQQIIYLGTDDGNVQRTLDGGASWQSVDSALPDRAVTDVTVHPEDPLTCYVSFSGYTLVDYTPHLFKTTDGGLSWMDVSGDLPDIPINDVLIEAAHDRLFVATDMGVWYSLDDGSTWNILGTNLPGIIMADLKMHIPSQTLFVGSYGRSMFSYDLTQLDNVSLGEYMNDSGLTLYPNPAQDFVQLDFSSIGELPGAITFRMIDMKGSLLKEGLETQRNGRVSIDLQGLAEGRYVLDISAGAYRARRALVIER